MKQIAILSDTHGFLRENVIQELAAADCIIHAGDVGSPNIIASMRGFGETYVVRGNNDKDWVSTLPKSLEFTIEDVRFFVIHDKSDLPSPLTHVDVVVYGHSHKYSATVINKVLYLNPGSCGKRRFNLALTMCRMTVNAGCYKHEKLALSHEEAKD